MEDDLDSMPTMKPGARVERAPEDEHSLDSMPTMKPGGASPESGGALGRIDQYELVRKLGGGGFGVVYLARDAVSGVEYALKTLHPLLKTNAEELERVRENFALVAKLLHPNIAAAHVLHRASDVAYASEETRRELRVMAGDPVMVMSYAPGVTLSAWRKQFAGGVVPFDRALEICRQVASALDYAHGERIVHRDIKPGNIMVETDGASGAVRARVLDFGLAAEIRSSMSRISREDGGTSGTRPYMAPEQWSGKRQDGRTDQYALACMLYELLDGRPPFAGVFETGDVGIMMHAVGSEEPEPIERLSAARNAALLKALAKKREERFATCSEFVAALGGEAAQVARPAGDAKPRVTSGDIDRELIALKVEMSERLDGVPENVAGDAELKPLYADARRKYKMAEEALKSGMKDAAFGFLREVAERLDAADAIIAARVEAERKVREEAERKAREEEAYRTRMEAERNERCDGRFAGDTRKVEIAPGVEIEFVWVAPGSFLMGSDDGDADDIEKPVHRVTLTKGYWIGKYEVTQAEWRSVMGENPSAFKGDRLPVEEITWYDCQEFVGKVNDRLKAEGEWLRVRLPTEAEWEFASRGGTKGKGYKYSGSDDIGKVAWYKDNSGGETREVGTKGANELGIHDMSGNVYEWCADWDGGYPSGSVADPRGPASGDYRVHRGGCWDSDASSCRSAYRSWVNPGFGCYYLGVRLAASAGQ